MTAVPVGTVVAGTPSTSLVRPIRGVKTTTSSVAWAVTVVPVGSVPCAVTVLTSCWPAAAPSDVWIGRLHVNCQASPGSSRPSALVIAGVGAGRGEGVTTAHRSSVRFTLLSGVFPGFVAT